MRTERNIEAAIHVLLVSFPAQGHINPMLRLGKRLASKGLQVTFSTAQSISKELRKANNIITDGSETTPFFRFEFFEDGLPPDCDSRLKGREFYFAQLEKFGRESIPQLIKTLNDVSCLVNSPFIPWVCDVAEDLGIPCATLWTQSCAIFTSYYHYSQKMTPFPTDSEPEIEVELPGLPVLEHDEISTFLYPDSPHTVFRRQIIKQFENLSKSFCLLANTSEDLEHDIIASMSRFCPLKPIGPLFKAPKDDYHVVAGAHHDCIEWLDSKPPSTVVYISFGTVAYLKQEQVDEIAHGVLNSGVSFLWVMRSPKKGSGLKPHVLPEGFLERIGDRGKFVEWSPQEQVLAHPSVTCFMTHCGWNSSVEALALGVPMVCFPQWGDQVTNAKFMVDVFGVGVRLGRGEAEDRVISRDEVERCLVEATVGEKAAEIKKNAMRWKKAAEDAVDEGGSSDRHLGDFVEEIKKRCT